MSWKELRLYFSAEEKKESSIFKNARSISEAAVAKATKANLPVIAVEGEDLVKLTNKGKYRRIIGKLTRRPRLLSGQKLEMP